MSVDYERFGLTPEEESLMIQMWNYGMKGRSESVWRIVGTNVGITALLVYAVAERSWIAGGIAILWIAYNTVAASLLATRDAPLFRSAMTKIEAELERCPPDPDSSSTEASS